MFAHMQAEKSQEFMKSLIEYFNKEFRDELDKIAPLFVVKDSTPIKVPEALLAKIKKKMDKCGLVTSPPL